MHKQFSDVYCKYGAPMGRRSYCDEPTAKVSLFRVRFVDGDYDDGGAYWGGNSRLYCARTTDGESVQLFVRVADREIAKRDLLARYPSLRFYR